MRYYNFFPQPIIILYVSEEKWHIILWSWCFAFFYWDVHIHVDSVQMFPYSTDCHYSMGYYDNHNNSRSTNVCAVHSPYSLKWLYLFSHKGSRHTKPFQWIKRIYIPFMENNTYTNVMGRCTGRNVCITKMIIKHVNNILCTHEILTIHYFTNIFLSISLPTYYDYTIIKGETAKP